MELEVVVPGLSVCDYHAECGICETRTRLHVPVPRFGCYHLCSAQCLEEARPMVESLRADVQSSSTQ